MKYPSLEKYNVALQSYNKTLTDKALSLGKLRKTPLGLPFALCGGFALTYQIDCAGSKYALRCFHKQSDNIEERYLAISKRLTDLNSNYFLKFEYQSQGIVVDGELFPIVKMEWADGTSLAEFLCNNYNSKHHIVNFRNSLVNLVNYLESNHIAHGDIQPGNIMVSNEGRTVQLIDYDGMFVEQIENLGASEIGHRNFQHPNRTYNDWNFNLDRFSCIQLYVSLRALEVMPSLWHETKSDIDAIIFRANDLKYPNNSQIFSKLKEIDVLKNDVNKFFSICINDFSKIPSINDFIDKLDTFNVSGSKIILTNTDNIYISAFDIVDGNNYSECYKKIGERVELIAKIKQVKFAWTRFHQPYVFINFSDWHGECVKLTIWGPALKKFRKRPDESWEGNWISTIGLMEPPYITKKYSHISIDITSPEQIHFITESEAIYRLSSKNNLDINNDNLKKQNNNGSINVTISVNSKKTDEEISHNNKSIMEKIRKLRNKH